MQYLSKAYNYYSGINPATLSGAIDVIVVRSTDDDGNDVLQSSPFHVRFGKLQVLRAGEKTVTLRLPNNLPAPHVAPFSMKVGETGEAFFVLETEEDVPEDLLTSPVVMPADAVTPPVFPIQEKPQTGIEGSKPLDGAQNNTSLTNQPFGQTEHVVRHDSHDDGPALPDVEPLDLNAAPEDATVTPKADKKERQSLDSSRASLDKPRKSLDGQRKSQDGRKRSPSDLPPNPLEAKPGEDTTLPFRDHRLQFLHRDDQDTELPKVQPGKHDGPPVRHGKDIVLDMDGFHAKDKKDLTKEEREALAADFGGEPPETILDLITPSPHTPKKSSDEKDLDATPVQNKVGNVDIEAFVNDLMASAPKPSLPHRQTTDDISASVASLSLDSPKRSPPVAKLRRGDRVQSEPPEEITRPSSPNSGEGMSPSQMDLAWDWGRGPEGERPAGLPVPHRSESLPIGDNNSSQQAMQALHAPRAVLKHVEDDGYAFILELDGRQHLFELALCGDDEFAPGGKADDDERRQFDDTRVTFQEFMDEPGVADDPKLVVRYEGLHLSWTTGYQILFALSLYRRSLRDSQPAKAATPQQSSGYWSRWWRGSRVPVDAPMRPSSAMALSPTKEGKEAAEAEKQLGANAVSAPGSELPTPAPPTPNLDTSDAGALPTTAPEAEAEVKHYAKTLRLSSDQLKQLNLKPGPNTIQFSVTSSYSGNAVVTARIFLWDENDQVIISDIDGTITKSDALGHVFAAIGRDWTHVGIANLYTDICNNGYKMIYLTARAIGQADTTREYLKTIVQGDYRMPEGPVIMSPDRLMASLHREVILRKPELFKMACLRDIQRLFASHAKEAFFAGFGNRITDAMSYRSVGIESGKIYTIDSTGIIKTELLQSSHKGSYVGLNDLVNEVFPPVKTKVKPEFTDFQYWRDPIPDVQLPDMAPPSPALSAVSNTSGGSRLSTLGKIVGLGRRGASRATSPEPGSPNNQLSRPSSPLIGPALTPGDLSEDEETWTSASQRASRPSSMPGSYEGPSNAFPDDWFERRQRTPKKEGDDDDSTDGEGEDNESGGYEDDDDIFDDDILATGEMANVPF